MAKIPKEPIEKGWQNNGHTHMTVFNHGLIGNGNYGVLGGCGDLIVIDADTEELDEVVKG